MFATSAACTSDNPSRKLLRFTALGLLFAPPLLLMPAKEAPAAWGSKACLKTKTADVSHLTITEGAEALGLNVLVSVMPEAVAELLDSSENITVFAPTDEAFGNIPEEILTPIVSDETLLTTVLAYHVSPKKVDPRRAFWVRKIDTLAEQKLFASRNRGEPMVNNSNVHCQGYKTANGLVWVIDSVLLPQF